MRQRALLVVADRTTHHAAHGREHVSKEDDTDDGLYVEDAQRLVDVSVLAIGYHRRENAAVVAFPESAECLEQLCRYITRPNPSDERAQLHIAEQVQLKLQKAWRECTTHLVMTAMEIRQRHFDGQLCGIELYERYVSCGSI